MMSVMPILPQAQSVMPSAAGGAGARGGDFAQTLRAESVSRSRSANRSAGREAQESHAAREAKIQAGERKEQEGGPADTPVSPDNVEPVAAAAGENDSAAGVPASRVGKGGVETAGEVSKATQEKQLPPSPEWLMLAQVVAPPVAVVASKAAEAEAVRGSKNSLVVADDVTASQAVVAPQIPASLEGLAGEKLLVGGLPSPGNTPVGVTTPPESEAITLTNPPAVSTEQILQQALSGGQKDMSEMAVGNGGPIDTKGSAETAESNTVALLQKSSLPHPPLVSDPVPPIAGADLASVPLAVSTPSGNDVSPRAVGVDPAVMAQAAAPAAGVSTIRAERANSPQMDNNPVTGPGQAVDSGRQAVVMVTPGPADSGSDARQFTSSNHTGAGEVEKSAKLADSGRAQFSALIDRPDNQLGGSVSRAADLTQAPAVAATPIAVPEARIVEQVVSRVSMSSAGGETNLSMLLHPKELGEVRVDLVSGKDGLRAHLHTQTQMVQEVLERNLPRLREAFESQGLKVSDLQVSCDDRRNGGGAAFRQDNGQALPSRYRPTEVLAGTVAAEWAGGPGATGSGWSAGSGFSLRV